MRVTPHTQRVNHGVPGALLKSGLSVYFTRPQQLALIIE